MSEIRVVLIMGGGVSLGSFSGGALARTLRLLAENARKPAKVDVVTGASAGSMTLAIAVYHLFRGAETEEIERDLEEAWVEKISFEGLEPPDLRKHDQPSLFTDRRLRDIAEEVLRFDRWTDRPPHPLLAPGLTVSFALTNLNGIPVRAEGQIIRQAQAGGGSLTGEASVFGDALQTTFHDDVMRFVLRRPPTELSAPALAIWREEAERAAAAAHARLLLPWTDEPMRRRWQIFREAAIASGAFPGAFPPVRLGRLSDEYGSWPAELGTDKFAFDYLDGGILRNEPLREAIHLASEQPVPERAERVFLLIDPNVSGSKEVYPLSFNRSVHLAEEVDDQGRSKKVRLAVPGYAQRLMGVLGRAGAVLASQATYRDWLKAARVNSQVEWRDQAEEIVQDLVPAAGSNVEERIDNLLSQIYEEKAMRSHGATPADVRATAAATLQGDLQRRSAGDGVTFSTKLLHLVDLIANLRRKTKLNMVAITPSSVPEGASSILAGNFLSNFGGFFQRSYRQHDYLKGVYVADQVLHAPIGDARPLLDPGARRPIAPVAPYPDPDYLSLDGGLRDRFEALLHNHAREALGGFGVPGIFRGIVADRLRKKVRSSLVSAAGPSAFVMLRIENAPRLFLRAGSQGEKLRADERHSIRTIVGIQQHSEGRSFRVYGPHLQGAPENAVGVLEVRAPGGFLRSSRTVATLRLEGRPQDWFERLRHCGAPLIEVRLNGGSGEYVITPADVRPDSFAFD